MAAAVTEVVARAAEATAVRAATDSVAAATEVAENVAFAF
jgi:hypothetical protein